MEENAIATRAKTSRLFPKGWHTVPRRGDSRIARRQRLRRCFGFPQKDGNPYRVGAIHESPEGNDCEDVIAGGDEGENATGRRFHPRSNENRELKDGAHTRLRKTALSVVFRRLVCPTVLRWKKGGANHQKPCYFEEKPIIYL